MHSFIIFIAFFLSFFLRVYGGEYQRYSSIAMHIYDWLICVYCVQHFKSVEEGTAETEAAMKMAIADSIFDDIIGDTAEALLEAHGLQERSSPASL